MSAVLEVKSDLPARAVQLPIEAYVSSDYARSEKELLWAKVWQVACREEEIPNVGDYCTYEILDQSVILTRVAADRIAAYHNVCLHRGRRLTAGCGQTSRFICKFHGWTWRLDGDDQMRYRWRQWLHFPCNWKIAIEAFIESYHVPGTHPQLLNFGHTRSWSRAHGKHSCMGIGAENSSVGGGTTSIANNSDADARKLAADYMAHLLETVNATTTQTIVDAAKRLVEVLPAGSPPEVVMTKMMELAAKADAERGVIWPTVDPKHFQDSGIDWHVFPNTVILHGITFILGYRARPNGFDPDSCIFEVFVLERYPPGEEPRPENVYKPDQSEQNWRLVLTQDFSNMGEVQKGVKSWGFGGPRPNPFQEQAVINFHRTLAHYMGRGAPEPIC